MLTLVRRLAAMICLASVPLTGADAQAPSCATMGWIGAVVEAVRRDPTGDIKAGPRLRDLTTRYDQAELRIALKEHLSPSQMRPVMGFLQLATERAAADIYTVDPFLRGAADRAMGVLAHVQCIKSGSRLARRTGASTTNSGSDGSDGRIYEARKRDSIFTPENFETALMVLTTIAAAIGAYAVFRFSSIIARRHKRHPCGMDCRLMAPNDEIYAGRMIDLSASGSRVKVKGAKLNPGRDVILVTGQERIASQILWTSSSAIGLKFNETLTTETLDEMLEQAQALHKKQRKRRLRTLIDRG